MAKNDRAFYEALVNLRGTPHYEGFVAGLQRRLDQTTDRLMGAPLDETQRLQGRALCLKDLLREVEEAPKLLQRG